MSLADLFAGRNVDIDGMMAHLREVAAQLELEFGARENTYNSRMAQELGKWAEDNDRGHDYHMAVFKAYFADGHNIADSEILISICRAMGLDVEEARRVIDTRAYKREVDQDWQRSRELGITAVPTFRLDGINLVGAQPYDKLADMLNRQVSTDIFDRH
jgi:predicted DsbA family dithiol-disulfide isomerase